MDLLGYFRTLARYNCIATGRLYDACAKLEDAEYRRERRGSFGSIHGLLNHVLLSDRIWMARFQGSGHETPPLATIVEDDFERLRSARVEEDARIEHFFASADADLLSREIPYVNNQGRSYMDVGAIAIGHFFNHQTHHRGQVHVMLSQTPVRPPALDLHRIINP